MDYSKLLTHPNWQRKRLEILQRDNFQCQLCKDKETTLHIHHLKYTPGKKPWEYKDEDLLTLCTDCHQLITELGFKESPPYPDLLTSVEVKTFAGIKSEDFLIVINPNKNKDPRMWIKDYSTKQIIMLEQDEFDRLKSMINETNKK